MLEPPLEDSLSAAAEPLLADEGSVQAGHSPGSHYRNVHAKQTLRRAWLSVLANGSMSDSQETRKQVREFGFRADQHLERIQRNLRGKKFSFKLSKGILQRRPGKRPRPIVKSPIENRIVQRAILDVLQSEPKLDCYYKVPTSFGGIKGKNLGVPGALEAAYKIIASDDGKFFVRSDIESFFTKIPRPVVLQKIKAAIGDGVFIGLLEKATEVELENLAELGKAAQYFPSYSLGVAQGCALSPLFGNILLEDFDREMNGRGIVCLRYIDDFILLGPSRKKVLSAFDSAQRILHRIGLSAYDPRLNKEKAEFGETDEGFEFLGCSVRPGLISPSKKSRARILGSVESILKASSYYFTHPMIMSLNNLTVVDTLREVSNVLKGWGNQYHFCNDRNTFRELDSKISDLINPYLANAHLELDILLKTKSVSDHRRFWGVHLLVDSKSSPIIASHTC